MLILECHGQTNSPSISVAIDKGLPKSVNFAYYFEEIQAPHGKTSKFDASGRL